MNTKLVGQKGEDTAAAYLKKKRYKILERNVRSKLGEIDIVAQNEDTMVFVEVKAGRFDPDFSPDFHWTPKKQQKLLMLGKAYLTRFKRNQNARFDLITVTEKAGELSVEHFENVLQDAAF